MRRYIPCAGARALHLPTRREIFHSLGASLGSGRDHSPNAMTIWLADGSCNAGHTIVATDKLGMEVTEGKGHIRDLHVTLLRLRLLNLDDSKLAFYHAGRFMQLSQFGSAVIKELIS